MRAPGARQLQLRGSAVASAPAVIIGSAQRAARLPEGAGRLPEGAARRGLTSMAAELAGWASSELPGQAAHRFLPHPPATQYGPSSDTAAWPASGMPADRGI